MHSVSSCTRRLHDLWRAGRDGDLHAELARAELAGELPELHALIFHALLAMRDGSGLASEYLEMAEAVAASPCEAALVAEHRAAHELLQGKPCAAAGRCRGSAAFARGLHSIVCDSVGWLDS